MDVIALDQAGHRRSGRAARHRADRGPARPALAALPCPDPLLRRRFGRAEGGGARGAAGAARMSGPGRSLGFVTLPAGQDPDDLIRAERPRGARRVARQARAAGRPALAPRARGRAARHARAARGPAGGGSSTMSRRSAIRDVREQYRSELLEPLQRADPAAAPAAAMDRRRRASRPGAARFAPPPRPTSAEAKAVGRGGLSPQLGRAVLHGLLRFPELIGAPCRGDRGPCRCADRAWLPGCATCCSNRRWRNAELDPERPQYHIGASVAGPLLLEELRLEARTGLFLHAT